MEEQKIKEILQKFEKIYDCLLGLNTDKDIYPYDYIFYWKGKRSRIIKLIKNFSEEWLQKKIEQIQNNHSKNFRKVFEKLGIKGNIYYTSFGFSYSMFCRNREQFEQDIKKIKDYLNSKGIKYTNEFSDARWVYRFRISQAKENLKRIS